MKLKEIFGANVRHYRKDRKMTQAQLAEEIDMSLDMIGKIERGVIAPSFETIEKLSSVLEIPEAVFFGAGVLSFPPGERGRLLQKINLSLSKMNENELATSVKMLQALKS